MQHDEALPRVASLWIGEHLSPLELLCLKSFVDAGHPVTLYSYGELKNPPTFCETRDAREIWDHHEILIHKKRQSPAIHSDIWRVKLLLKTDAIWVDTDAYCHKPLKPIEGYLFGIQDKRGVASGVMRLPQDSKALVAFNDFLSTHGAIPPWWSDEQTKSFTQKHTNIDFQDMKWGTTGPLGLTHFLKQSGEFAHALPQSALYPLPQGDKSVPLHHASVAEAFITKDTVSVHFYANGFRKILSSQGVSTDSYLAKLFRQHNLPVPRPTSLEIPTAPKKAEKRWQRRNRRLAYNLVFDILAKARGRNSDKTRCIQVGANDGRLADPVFPHIASKNITGLLIEPSPVYFSSLQETHRENTDIRLENVGVSDQEGELTLYQLAPAYQSQFPGWARGCASMSREQLVSSLAAVRPVEDKMIEANTVPVMRLDSLIRIHNMTDAELLVIDVEGFEASVFRSFEFEGFLPFVIAFEYTHTDQTDAAEIFHKLHSAGYRMWIMLHDIVAIHETWLSNSIEEVFGLLSIPEWTCEKDAP